MRTKTSSRFFVLSSAVALASAVGTSAARAQTTIEEIVVTAQKREQNQQDVPISVSAIVGDSLQARNLTALEALSTQIPNVQIAQSAIGDKLFIRGIGSGINPGFEQSVGTFMDGIYYGRSLQTRAQFLDVARVEVLRGPQSTYFGNNTIAGALNITSTAPTNEFSGYINSFYEVENHEHHIEAAVSGPLSDTVSIRVAGLSSGLKGWVDNLITGQTEGDEDNSAGRLSLHFTPNDIFDASVKVESGRYEVLGRNLEVIDCPPASGAAGICAIATAPVLAGFGPQFNQPLFPDFNDTFDLHTEYNGPVPPAFTKAVNTLGAGEAKMAVPAPTADLSARDLSVLNNTNTSLTMNWQLPTLTVTAVTGYSKYDFDFHQSSDFLPIPLAGLGQLEGFNQLSQELRLGSATDGRLEYMAGVYYQLSHLDIKEDIDLYLAPPYFQPAATYFTDACRAPARADDPTCRLPATIASAYSVNAQREDTWAAFASFTWHINDTWRATLGLRYTDVDKTLDRRQNFVDKAPGVTVPCPPAYAAALGCIVGAPLLMTADSPPRGRAFGWMPGTLQLARNDTAFTPSVNLQWDPRDNMMLYASYSQGFKAGGFDQRNVALDPVYGKFGPESVDSWEVGLKSRILDGDMQLNLAAFHSTYDDLQVSTFDGVINFLVNNAGSAQTQGLESDVRWLLSDNLVLSSSLAWLDAKWKHYGNAQCTAADLAQAPNANCTINPATGLLVQDLSGADLPMAPRWSGNVSLDYYRSLSRGMSLQSGLQVVYQDDKYLAADNDPATVQSAFTKLNLRLALASDSGWELALVGRNLTNKLTASHSEDMPLRSVNSFFRLSDRPRTIALQARYNW